MDSNMDGIKQERLCPVRIQWVMHSLLTINGLGSSQAGLQDEVEKEDCKRRCLVAENN